MQARSYILVQMLPQWLLENPSGPGTGAQLSLERQPHCRPKPEPTISVSVGARTQANADLQKVAHEKVASMRAERDALAAEVAAARRQLAERQDDSEQVSHTCTALALVAAPAAARARGAALRTTIWPPYRPSCSSKLFIVILGVRRKACKLCSDGEAARTRWMSSS